jgi:hypothetical protein
MNAIVEKEMVHSWDIFPEYVKVMDAYLTHFTESKKYKQRDKDNTYLLINGFSTLTHVFKITLKHQWNASETGMSETSISETDSSETSTSLSKTGLKKAVENTEKAIYYYTQFIEQIDENILYDLNVSSNSASLFVFKKTINFFFPEPKQPADNVIRNVEYVLLLYRTIFDILIQAEYNSLLPTKLINIALELCRNNNDELLFHQEMKRIMLFVNHFPHQEKIYNSAMLGEHIYYYIKKAKTYKLTLERLCYKKTQPDYADKLKESPINFIKWLLY